MQPAGQQQPGDVGAGDEEDQRHRSEQRHSRRRPSAFRTSSGGRALAVNPSRSCPPPAAGPPPRRLLRSRYRRHPGLDDPPRPTPPHSAAIRPRAPATRNPPSRRRRSPARYVGRIPQKPHTRRHHAHDVNGFGFRLICRVRPMTSGCRRTSAARVRSRDVAVDGPSFWPLPTRETRTAQRLQTEHAEVLRRHDHATSDVLPSSHQDQRPPIERGLPAGADARHASHCAVVTLCVRRSVEARRRQQHQAIRFGVGGGDSSTP